MAEKSVELDSIELAAAIFGNCDQNVKLLENEFHVTAVCRGSVLRFTGEQKDVDAAARAVDGMVTLMENHTPLEEQTVRYCISLAHGGEEKRLRELEMWDLYETIELPLCSVLAEMEAEGFLIENGEITRPVEQITVAGNFFKLLNEIKETADDLKFGMSGIGSPSVSVENVNISGL